MTFTAYAHCLTCPWVADADTEQQAHRDAEKHTKTTGHPTEAGIKENRNRPA